MTAAARLRLANLPSKYSRCEERSDEAISQRTETALSGRGRPPRRIKD